MRDTIKDPQTGQFLPGNKSGGRPKGARAKLGEAFLEDMRSAWELQGKEVIDRVIAERPHEFMKVIASFLPRDVNLTVNNMDEATDDELIKRIRDIDAAIRPFLASQGEAGTGEGTGAARPN